MCNYLEEVNSAMIRSHFFTLPTLSYYHGPIVKAISSIKKDAVSERIDFKELSENSTFPVIFVEITESNGRLYSLNKRMDANFWLKMVNFSVDCQTYNIILMPSENGVVIKAIRDIAPGEFLYLWFSSDILFSLNIPFLTGNNIQSKNRYICHTCYKVYEHPNPLKIHMFLDCDRLDRNHLWNVLSKGFETLRDLSLSRPFLFQLNDPTNATSPVLLDTANSHLHHTPSPTPSNQPSTSSSTEPSPTSSHSPSSIYTNEYISHRLSAFKPYTNTNISRRVPNVRPSVGNPRLIFRSNFPSDPADIENFASDIKKSRNGKYLCIYCHKGYSRKYGLKLHIRTHTSYKPLVCKYCSRSFSDPSNMNKHLKLHRNSNSTYKCSICGKVLIRRRDLERHHKTKHENKLQIRQIVINNRKNITNN